MGQRESGVLGVRVAGRRSAPSSWRSRNVRTTCSGSLAEFEKSLACHPPSLQQPRFCRTLTSSSLHQSVWQLLVNLSTCDTSKDCEGPGCPTATDATTVAPGTLGGLDMSSSVWPPPALPRAKLTTTTEFDFRALGDGRSASARYANHSNYRNDSLIRKESEQATRSCRPTHADMRSVRELVAHRRDQTHDQGERDHEVRGSGADTTQTLKRPGRTTRSGRKRTGMVVRSWRYGWAANTLPSKSGCPSVVDSFR